MLLDFKVAISSGRRLVTPLLPSKQKRLLLVDLRAGNYVGPGLLFLCGIFFLRGIGGGGGEREEGPLQNPFFSPMFQ